MDSSRSRWRGAAFVVVTLTFIIAEFVFLQALFHLDDGADERDLAQARAAVALAVWQPGAATDPVADAVRRLADSGVPGDDELRTRLDAWTESGTASELTALRDEVSAAGADVTLEQRRVDREVTMVFLVLLLVVSVGWYVYFRRLSPGTASGARAHPPRGRGERAAPGGARAQRRRRIAVLEPTPR